MDAWRQVLDLIEDQHGVVGAGQLDSVGVTERQRRWWVESGRVHYVAPRVLRLVGAPSTWHQRLHTGLLALGRMSWVSHEAAAQQHGFDRTPADRVEFLVLRGHRSATLDEEVHSTRRWGRVDEVIVDGLRTTSATRTILDLANARAHPDRLCAAIDSAVRMQLSSPHAIRVRLDEIRSKGRAGVRRIEQLLLDSGGHTMLERRFLRLVREWGLPRPDTQAVIRDDGGRFVARVDFYYPGFDVVVEVSGKLGHSSPEERARDAQRRNELQKLGMRVYEFTWEDVTQRETMVASQMRKILSTPA